MHLQRVGISYSRKLQFALEKKHSSAVKRRNFREASLIKQLAAALRCDNTHYYRLLYQQLPSRLWISLSAHK